MRKKFATIIALILCSFACSDDSPSQKTDVLVEEEIFKTEKTFRLIKSCGTLEYHERLGMDFESGFEALKETFTHEKNLPIKFDTMTVDFHHDDRLFIGIAFRDDRGMTVASTKDIIDTNGNRFIWWHCED
ncbi:MAG: hypothetical protein LBK65_00345 [Tannerellaceae bacterium]|jgi:hypothetical protein|nr:hypothetical protein [Tannerellaceae bacterium]